MEGSVDVLNLLSGCLNSRARCQAGEHIGHAMASVILHGGTQVVVVTGIIDVKVLPAHRRIVGTRLENSHDTSLLNRQIENLSQGSGIASKHPAPIFVGKNHHGLRTLIFVLQVESSTPSRGFNPRTEKKFDVTSPPVAR